LPSGDKAFVTLKEELDYARFYIYLQQQRFGGKFEVDIDAGGVPEDTPVPRFCIQPLVENAILHGFEPQPDDGRAQALTVRVSPEGEGLRVRVEDNGVGLPDGFSADAGNENTGFRELSMKRGREGGTRTRLGVGLADKHTDGKHSGVALKNLNARLVLLGGKKSRLSAFTEGGKTVVTFWLPGKA
jgi:sensor histidine kinase YesM